MAMKAEDLTFSPILEGKIRLWYKMVSGGKDMGQTDFEAWAKKIITDNELAEEHELAKEVREWLVGGWDRIFNLNKEQQPGTELSKYAEGSRILKEGGNISGDLFTEAFKELLIKNPKLTIEVLQRMISTCFDVFDRDSDGFLTKDEVAGALKNFGFDSPEMVSKIFQNLKEDSCDRLSKDQYLNGWLQFFLKNE